MARLKAKLIGINVPAGNAESSQNFYRNLMGIDFARSFSNKPYSLHAPISEDGLWLMVSQRNAAEEGIGAMFAVDDLKSALGQVASEGGKVVSGPFPLPIAEAARAHYDATVAPSPGGSSMGNFALVQDCDGNYFWLGELEEHAHQFYGYGKYDRGLSQAKLERHKRTQQVGATLP